MQGNVVDSKGRTSALVGEVMPGAPVPTHTQQLIHEERLKGKSFRAISEKFSITPEEAYRIYNEYVESSQQLNEAEYRMLQLQRLEKMIDAVWGMATSETMASIDHMKVMLDVLKEISKTLGLHKAKTEQTLQVIDQRQVHLVVNYVDMLSDTLKQNVLKTVTAKKAREQIEEKWDEWVAEASERPLEAMKKETIKV